MADDINGSLPPGVQFNPQDPGHWDQFRRLAETSTQGINKMPFVFGGGDKGYSDLKGMSSDDIKKVFYSDPWSWSGAGGGGSGGGADINSIIRTLTGGGGLGGLGIFTSGPAMQLAAQAGGVRGGDSGLGFVGGGSQFSPTMTPTAQPVSGSTSGGLGMMSDAQLAAMGFKW